MTQNIAVVSSAGKDGEAALDGLLPPMIPAVEAAFWIVVALAASDREHVAEDCQLVGGPFPSVDLRVFCVRLNRALGEKWAPHLMSTMGLVKSLCSDSRLFGLAFYARHWEEVGALISAAEPELQKLRTGPLPPTVEENERINRLVQELSLRRERSGLDHRDRIESNVTDTTISEIHGPSPEAPSAGSERTRVQRLVAELIREAVKDKLAKTHRLVPLHQVRGSVGKCFDLVGAGERLLILRKVDPIAVLEPLPERVPNLPRVSTRDIQDNRDDVLGQVEAGSSFVVERAKRGRGSKREPVAVLGPVPPLSEEELLGLKLDVRQAFPLK